MLAALAAAIGLCFSAWTGWYQVQATKDQLAQSAEESEKELQAQAALVSTWTLEDSRGWATSYFANRSLDPVSQVTLVLATGIDGEPVPKGEFRNTSALLELRDVPPCSRVTIPPTTARDALGATTRNTGSVVAAFSFVDARGHRWGRSVSRPLSRMQIPGSTLSASPLATWRLAFDGKKPPRGLTSLPSRPGARGSDVPAPEPLKDCGANNK
ncbi:hypothetical protein [Streptomyces fungicidicus]|uniref:hypothetical protein n=1 Tax=Streptomyces fungicidicus TaxID=68203 RepID=UPI0033E07F9E